MELPLDAAIALPGLPFGSPRNEVRAFFGDGSQPFQRTPACSEGDYWTNLGIFASYDGLRTLEAIEFAALANPTLSGQILTALSLQKAKQLLRSIDAAIEDEGSAAISKRFGISVWTGAGLHGMVKSVFRFRPGYYD